LAAGYGLILLRYDWPVKDLCREKDRLLDINVNVTHAYAEAVKKLHQCSERKDASQFEALHRIAETARNRAENARIDYERHVAEHGC
jgi:hypothetical protein